MSTDLKTEYKRVYAGKEIQRIREKISMIPDGSLMKTVILVALDQIGKEGKNIIETGQENTTRYAEVLDEEQLYNSPKQGMNWCDIFVDYLYTVASGGIERAKDITYQTGDYGAGVAYSYEYYASNNALHSPRDTTSPQIGDQIFLRTRTNPRAHTGIVVARDNQYVYTIEGNTVANPNIAEENTTADQREVSGQGVYLKRYKRDSEKIVGYGRPKLTETERLSKDSEQDINNAIILIYRVLNRNLTPLFPDFSDISDFPTPENVVEESLLAVIAALKNNTIVKMRIAQDNRDYAQRNVDLKAMLKEQQIPEKEQVKGV